MKTIDDVRAAGIVLYRESSDGSIRFKGPDGSRAKLGAALADRTIDVWNNARDQRVTYQHARICEKYIPSGTYGLCELCGGALGSHESGCCLLCEKVVARAMEQDRQAKIQVMDTETTGIDPNRCGVIEVALITLDRVSLVETDRYEAKMPIRFYADERALEINGYSPEAWADAIPHEQVYAELRKRIRPCDIILGHTINFDTRMLAATARMLGIEWLELYRERDIKPIAGKLLKGKMPVASQKLTTFTSFLNIPHLGAHSAMADVEATAEVYRWCQTALKGA